MLEKLEGAQMPGNKAKARIAVSCAGSHSTIIILTTRYFNLMFMSGGTTN